MSWIADISIDSVAKTAVGSVEVIENHVVKISNLDCRAGVNSTIDCLSNKRVTNSGKLQICTQSKTATTKLFEGSDTQSSDKMVCISKVDAPQPHVSVEVTFYRPWARTFYFAQYRAFNESSASRYEATLEVSRKRCEGLAPMDCQLQHHLVSFGDGAQLNIVTMPNSTNGSAELSYSNGTKVTGITCSVPNGSSAFFYR